MHMYDGRISEWSPTVSDYSPPLAQSADQLHGIPCVYGKWRGPGCSGPGAPVDDVDQCCQAHDHRYANRGYFACSCNRKLLSYIAPKRDMNTPKGKAAWAVWGAFRGLPCNPLSGLAGNLAEAPAGQSQLVRVANTLVAPYRNICRIVTRAFGKPDNAYSVGTGFLVSPYHVLTCAHNIYPIQAPRTKSIDVFISQNGPDENARRFRANGWAVRQGWGWGRDCRASGEDYGIIRLATAASNDFLRLQPFNPAILTGKTAQLAGYPSTAQEPRARFMHQSAGSISGAFVVDGCDRDRQGGGRIRGRLLPSILTTTSLLLHGLATAPSISGSPIWIEEGGTRTIVGIHERRMSDDQSGRRVGAAVLINDAVRAQVGQWMNTALPPLRR
jgi:V8-like Glu-specific endopeptidase